MLPSDITNRFTFHPAMNDEKRLAHEAVRDNCKSLAEFLNDLLPEGREKALAITHLEEVMMWSNASLAREA
jgi:hypothetical protein